MQAPKTPNWIIWLLKPKYCFSILRLNIQRSLATKGGRREFWVRAYRWIKKNILIASFLAASYQGYVEREWRNEAEHKQAETAKENSFIRGVITMRNSDMKTFPYPWWQKLKRGDDYRFLDLNKAYEKTFGYSKMKSIGKSNIDVFGNEVGKVYRANDSIVLAEWKNIITIEPAKKKDSLTKKVLVIKYPERTLLGDSIASGMTIPLGHIIKIIDETGKHEVITIRPAPNQMQDTIILN